MSNKTFEKIQELSKDIIDGPHGWIQHKGSKLCMDIHCRCGKHMHVDDDFVYFVHCPWCDTFYAVGSYVRLVPFSKEEILDGRTHTSVVKELDNENYELEQQIRRASQ